MPALQIAAPMRGASAVCPPRQAWRSVWPPARAGGSRAGTCRAARVSGGGNGAGAAARGRCALRQGALALRRFASSQSLISIRGMWPFGRLAVSGVGGWCMRCAARRAARVQRVGGAAVRPPRRPRQCVSHPEVAVSARRAVSVRSRREVREVRGAGRGRAMAIAAAVRNARGRAAAVRLRGGMCGAEGSLKVAARRLVWLAAQQLSRAGEGAVERRRSRARSHEN